MKKTKEYEFKTTTEQYKSIKSQSKNKGELLYNIWKNETGDYVPYPVFLSKLATWIMKTKFMDTSRGIEKINNYLDNKLAQK